MGERVGQITKVPEVKKSSSNSRVRRTKRLQSMDTPADRILFLQRTAGNQAVSRLIRSGALQANLRIGQPGDMYEQEANRVADAVMTMPHPRLQSQPENEEEEETVQTRPLADQITPLVQRQEEPVQAKFKDGDVVFGSGEYQPQSKEGKQLLGHELTHVAQQSSEKAIQRILGVTPKLERLRELLKEDLEDAAIVLMGYLSPKEVREVLARREFKELAMSAFNNKEMYRAIKAMRGDLYPSLEWMFDEGTDWSKVRDVIARAPSGKDRVRSDNWMKDQFVSECNDEEMAEAVVLLGGTEKQQRKWMEAKGADWTLVLGRLQYNYLEKMRKDEENKKKKEAEETAKKLGKPMPITFPKVTIDDIVEKQVNKGKLPTHPKTAWEVLTKVQKTDWKERRAPEALKKLMKSIKGTELEKVMEDESADYEFDPEYALKKGAYAWHRAGRFYGNTLGFGMAFVKDIEHDEKIVWPILAHEIGGHAKYGKTFSSKIMDEALDLMPKHIRKRWQDTKEARQQFFETYKYPETEIYAALCQLRYEIPLSGPKPKRRPLAVDPYTNIPDQLSNIKRHYDPEVAKAVLRVLGRRVRDSSEIVDRDKKYFIKQVKLIFK